MYRIKELIVLLACCLALVQGNANGAPPEACPTMTPQHGDTVPQTKTPPYKILVAKNKVSPGGSLDVTITGGSFKGFLIQARVGDAPVSFGQFAPTNGDAQAVNCGGGNKNAITHTKPNIKNGLTVKWTAPNSLKEKVQFWATVAKDGGTYWVGLKSAEVTVE